MLPSTTTASALWVSLSRNPQSLFSPHIVQVEPRLHRFPHGAHRQLQRLRDDESVLGQGGPQVHAEYSLFFLKPQLVYVLCLQLGAQRMQGAQSLTTVLKGYSWLCSTQELLLMGFWGDFMGCWTWNLHTRQAPSLMYCLSSPIFMSFMWYLDDVQKHQLNLALNHPSRNPSEGWLGLKRGPMNHMVSAPMIQDFFGEK